jgi:hypothetical protein
MEVLTSIFSVRALSDNFSFLCLVLYNYSTQTVNMVLISFYAVCGPRNWDRCTELEFHLKTI